MYLKIRDTVSSPYNRSTVSRLCELAGVSRSGYYNWLRSCETRARHEIQDHADFENILEAYHFRGYDKGTYGIHMRLLHMGIRMNHKKIRRLMRKYELVCPIRKANPYRRMAKSLRTNVVADNSVNREFRNHGPRKIFLTDITYIPVKNGFFYLSVIIDAFTKQVLAYELSDSLEVEFVLQTVRDLIRDHGVSINADAYIHSDQGCHYTSISFRELIRDVNLIQSMSRKGNCWDNAPQESFFGHMKEELRRQSKTWRTFEEVKLAIDDWMDYYNNDRYQMALKKMSPNEYYHYLTTQTYPTSMLI